MDRHSQYPRFFVRDADTPLRKIAKAETEEDAQQYTPANGWQEYGSLLSGGVHIPRAGHTMGLNVEGDEE